MNKTKIFDQGMLLKISETLNEARGLISQRLGEMVRPKIPAYYNSDEMSRKQWLKP